MAGDTGSRDGSALPPAVQIRRNHLQSAAQRDPDGEPSVASGPRVTLGPPQRQMRLVWVFYVFGNECLTRGVGGGGQGEVRGRGGKQAGRVCESLLNRRLCASSCRFIIESPAEAGAEGGGRGLGGASSTAEGPAASPLSPADCALWSRLATGKKKMLLCL